jgi:hypothetical protein
MSDTPKNQSKSSEEQQTPPVVLKRIKPEPEFTFKSKEGKSDKGDYWLHPEVLNEDYEKATNRAIRSLTDMEKSLFYIDLKKAGIRRLHKEKLVRRPVQVRGKNGKVFTRMQWVDPRTGQPVSQSAPKQQEEWKPQSHPQYKEATRPTSDKHPDDMNREEFIDHHVRKVMNRDQQYEMLDKHGVQWKRNDHPSIDHKNAIVALKDHLNKNPHLIGAEHKPTAEEQNAKSPTGTDSPNEFWNMWEKDKSGSYDLMRRLGIIGEDEEDPRENIDENDKTKKQLAAMKHMRYVMLLKKYLKDNPHIMKDPKYLPNNNAGKEEAKKIERESKGIQPTVAQKGGNDINDILKSLPSERLYDLMKQAGIADSDPRLDPQKTPQVGALAHHRNMILLKKHIEKHPEILREDEKGNLSKEEKERIASLPDKERDKERIKAFVRDMSDDDIQDAMWFVEDNYADDVEDYGADKLNNKHPQISNMHRKSFLAGMFEKHPELMEEYKGGVENTRLMQMKIGNKTMRALLTSLGGLKAIGDVFRPENDEGDRQTEWMFHGGDSSAKYEVNADGVPVLSVIDNGDPDVWNEFEIPLKDVKSWLTKRKEGKQTGASGHQLRMQEKPLHRRPVDQIEQALEDNFDGNYNEEVGQVMKSHLGKAWKVSGKGTSIGALANKMNKMSVGTVKKLLNKWGVQTFDGAMSTFNARSDGWKKIAYADDIDAIKGKNAWDYMNKGDYKVGETTIKDPFVLIESAKNWSDADRQTARRELVSKAINVPPSMHKEDHEQRMKKLSDHFRIGMGHVPFDMLSHLHAKGLKLSIRDRREADEPKTGNFFNPTKNECVFSGAYYHDKSVFEEHPMRHKPEDTVMKTNKGSFRIKHWDFQDNIVHETAHAIDAMFSNSGGGVHWDNKELLDKLIPKEHQTVIPDSYKSKIEQSNPKYEIAMGGIGTTNYPYVKDQWFTTYEGRLYNSKYERFDPEYVKIENNKPYDKQPLNTDGVGSHGSEHWTESVSAWANARQGYELYKKVMKDKGGDPYGSLDKWAEAMANHMKSKNYGADWDKEQAGPDNGLRSWVEAKHEYVSFSGWKYHYLQKHSQLMHDGLEAIFGRGDFKNDDE